MHVMRPATQHRRRHRPIQNEVFVDALVGIEARRESVRRDLGFANAYVGRQRRVERERQPSNRKLFLRFERNDLCARVHAGIGSTCGRNSDFGVKERAKRPLYDTRDRSQLRLELETVKVGAVVLDDQTIREQVRRLLRRVPVAARAAFRRDRADRPTPSRRSDPARRCCANSRSTFRRPSREPDRARAIHD